MKHSMRKFWAAICTVWASTASTLTAFAAEQGTEVAESANLMSTMDVLQKISLVIIIIAAVLIMGFYVVKMILKKMHVPPEEKQNEPEQKE